MFFYLGRRRGTLPHRVLDRAGRGRGPAADHLHDRRLAARAPLQARPRKTPSPEEQLRRELERGRQLQRRRERECSGGQRGYGCERGLGGCGG